jgi:peptidoglycan/LPS O-acetylase OafA/YrhL
LKQQTKKGAELINRRRPTLPALTVLRFFAAMAVVLFHYGYKKELFGMGLSSFGYEAVTFFFVLSGFILAYVHGEAFGLMNVDSQTFLVARFARIYPAYLLGLVLSAPFFIRSAVVGKIDSGAFLIGAILVPLLLQAWWPAAALAWNFPAWSLSVEMFLYSLFPRLWRLVFCFGAWQFLIGSYAIVVAVSLIWRCGYESWGEVPVLHNLLAYFPLFHLPQFVLGVALGRLFLDAGARASLRYGICLATGMIATVLIAIYKAESPWLASNALLGPVFGVLILGAAGVPQSFSNSLFGRALVFLGEASYAMYILHVPLGYWWIALKSRAELLGHLPFALDFACYLLLLILTSAATMKLIELPARRMILQAYQRPVAINAGE